ncbi:hypothetical protein COE25_29855 [Bacillus sp. AFS031507]|nr:hypothetical protein COE25_29855 [Bacillus sp. AFS031507]
MLLTYNSPISGDVIPDVVDSIFTYVLVDWLRRLGIASLVRMKKIHVSLIFLIESLLLYGFQFFKEKTQEKDYCSNQIRRGE